MLFFTQYGSCPRAKNQNLIIHQRSGALSNLGVNPLSSQLPSDSDTARHLFQLAYTFFLVRHDVWQNLNAFRGEMSMLFREDPLLWTHFAYRGRRCSSETAAPAPRSPSLRSWAPGCCTPASSTGCTPSHRRTTCSSPSTRRPLGGKRDTKEDEWVRKKRDETSNNVSNRLKWSTKGGKVQQKEENLHGECPGQSRCKLAATD